MTERKALTLSEIREIQLEAMKKLRDTCEAHGLTYFLIGGTLLGAVRHHGFIPWDNDTDICMPWPDYKKLLEIWPRYIDEDWEFRHYLNLENFLLRHADLCSRHVTDAEINGEAFDRPIAGCGVDIFPLFFTENREQCEIVTKTLKKNQRLAINGKISADDFTMIHRWAEMKMEAVWSDAPDALATGLGASICRRNEFLHNGETNRYVTFEGEQFRAPADWDRVLRQQYGDDYMTPVDYHRDHGVCYWK